MIRAATWALTGAVWLYLLYVVALYLTGGM